MALPCFVCLFVIVFVVYIHWFYSFECFVLQHLGISIQFHFKAKRDTTACLIRILRYKESFYFSLRHNLTIQIKMLWVAFGSNISKSERFFISNRKCLKMFIDTLTYIFDYSLQIRLYKLPQKPEEFNINW